MTLAILILAAGTSSRMGAGRDKLAERVGPRPLLRHICEEALSTGLQVYACLPGETHARFALLPEAVTPVWVPDAKEGMAASIRRGVAALPESVEAVMLLPADMPELTTADLSKVAAQHRANQITRGASDSGIPGHPVVFPRSCFAELQDLRGDQGARQIVQNFTGPITLVALPDQHALTDLDTPEAWEQWRKGLI